MNKLISKVKSSDVCITFPSLKDVNNVKVAVYAIWQFARWWLSGWIHNTAH